MTFPKPTAHWRLNGVPDDYAGNGNNATWTGTEAYAEFNNGKMGALLAGADYLTSTTPALSGRTFSIILKLKFDASSIKALTTLFNQHIDGVAGRMLMAYENVGNTLRVQEEGTTRTSFSFTPVVGKEYALCFTMSDGYGDWYVDAVPQTLITDTQYSQNIAAVVNSIGRYNSGAAAATDFYGTISVKIFNGVALTPAQVKALYQQPELNYVPTQEPIPQRSPLYSPVSSWGFNNGFGFKDGSGTSDATGVLVGLEQHGFKFVTTSQFQTSLPIDVSEQYTFAAIVEFNPSAGIQTIFGCDRANGIQVRSNGYNVQVLDGGLGSDDLLTTDSPLRDWKKQLIVVVWDGTNSIGKIYVDGILSISGAIQPATYTDYLFRFGTRYGAQGLVGTSREIAVYDKLLTADQVATIYDESVLDPSLILSTNDGLRDNSKNGIAITLTNCVPGNGKMVFTNGSMAFAAQTFTSYEYSYKASGSDRYVHYLFDGTNTYTNGVVTGSMPVSIGATGFSGATGSMKDMRLYDTVKSATFAAKRYIKSRRFW